jgi:tyrosyl-tRNA synthetase
MSLPDTPMRDWFILCTDVPEAEIEQLISEAESGKTNPKLVKQRLAREIIAIYHGADAAAQAEEAFTRVFSQHQVPEEMPDVVVPKDQIEAGTIGIVALVRLAGFAGTNSEARRLVEQGGVSIDGEKITDGAGRVAMTDGAVLKVGKRNFARVKA